MVIAADLVLAMDPAEFSASAGMVPDDWQARVLRSQASRLLLNCARQSGKSTTVAALAIHEVLYKPRSLVILLSPTLRQSSELFKKAAAAYLATGRMVPPESETALTLSLEHSSRLVSLPGKEATVRRYSDVDLLVIDEAARVSSDLYLSVRPMLAVSGGRLLSPAGR
jgi:hypothetical protein